MRATDAVALQFRVMRVLDEHLLHLLERHASRLGQYGEHKRAARCTNRTIQVQHAILAKRVAQQRKRERSDKAASPVGNCAEADGKRANARRV